MNRRGIVAALLCSLALVSACGGGGSSSGAPGSTATSPSGPSSSAAASPDAAGSPDAAFCAGFEKNGGTAASIGEPPVFSPKDTLVSYAQETLGVMKGLTPPPAIAAAWTTYQQFQTRLLAAAKALGAGQRLSGPVPGMDAVPAAYKTVNDWISANC